MTDPMTQAGDWTPQTPLRADATDEQIVSRLGWLHGHVLVDGLYRRVSKNDPHAAPQVAREFAAACVTEREAEISATIREADRQRAASQGTTRPTRDLDGLTDELWCGERDIQVTWTDRRTEDWRRLRATLERLALWDTPEGEKHGR